jgi:threonine/homoserine/homoserine lactone efflux protein
MSGANFSLFLLAALVIAAIPGPGIFYVAARTLSGGRQAGIASTFGTALGGLVHVVAGGFGVSAIILASAQLFALLKLIGALYLVWLGVRAFREAGHAPPEQMAPSSVERAFREGVLVEALNPKTAAFFLAFIPQFLDPAAGHPGLQFMALGLISVTLNTFADVIVVMVAARARAHLVRRPMFVQRLRQGSGLFIAGLGISLAFARRPATG